jgi:hypothetical protein
MNTNGVLRSIQDLLPGFAARARRSSRRAACRATSSKKLGKKPDGSYWAASRTCPSSELSLMSARFGMAVVWVRGLRRMFNYPSKGRAPVVEAILGIFRNTQQTAPC